MNPVDGPDTPGGCHKIGGPAGQFFSLFLSRNDPVVKREEPPFLPGRKKLSQKRPRSVMIQLEKAIKRDRPDILQKAGDGSGRLHG
ncbi:hypothetical protein [Leptospirillum ferriphilum]|uniref:hypothetical protein n=1 Tax=Leptospirillum ferriphilum TaxID=178606 RepID=UPI00059F0A6B|nr:hypothetical protein [Leptospirillum ferriphilum]